MNVCKFTFVNLLIPQEYHFVFTFTLHVQQKRIKYTCFVQEKGGKGGGEFIELWRNGYLSGQKWVMSK